MRHQLYLAFKEALHNVIKHAGATEVRVQLEIDAELISLSVEDNGRGFEANHISQTEGDGLKNLRHRMEEIGGKFEQTSSPTHGTRITFIASAKGKA